LYGRTRVSKFVQHGLIFYCGQEFHDPALPDNVPRSNLQTRQR
jgi:hypothetical protein